MSFIARISLLLFFFSLCVGGAVLAPQQSTKIEPQKMNPTPIKNHEPFQRIWIQV
jgi:hypothetical protein